LSTSPTSSTADRTVRYELADPHLARALRELIDVVLAVDPVPSCGLDDGVGRRVMAPAAAAALGSSQHQRGQVAR